jgi:hypothetical protein
MQLFNEYNFLYKDLFFYNINYFFYYIKTSIWNSFLRFKINKNKNKNARRRNFNLRNFVFACLQQGIYITFFRSTLI